MGMKQLLVKDLLCVMAYGTSNARASAAKLLFYYWPTFNSSLFERKGAPPRVTSKLFLTFGLAWSRPCGESVSRGAVVVALALWSRGPGFDSQPGDPSLMISSKGHLRLAVGIKGGEIKRGISPSGYLKTQKRKKKLFHKYDPIVECIYSLGVTSWIPGHMDVI